MTALELETEDHAHQDPAYEAAWRLLSGWACDDDVALARTRLALAGDPLARLAAAGWSGAGRPTDDIIGKALQAVLDEPAPTATEEARPTEGAALSNIVPRDSLIATLFEEAQARASARVVGEPIGPEVCAVSPRLHDAVGEALPVGMTTLDGGPGSGKTALALQIAMTARVPALIVECEVRPVRILERMIAFKTETFLRKLKDGTLLPETIRDRARETLDALPFVEIVDATVVAVTMDDIVRDARNLRDRHGSEHVLVVVDSLHAWAARALKIEKEYDRLTQALRVVDGGAKENNIAVLAILERSLATMQSPSATSGKGHAGIGYNAEIALNLDARGPTDLSSGRRRIDLTVSKNRHGEQGFAIALTFEGRLQKFAEALEDDASGAALAAITSAVSRVGGKPICDDGESLDPRTGEAFPSQPEDDDDLPTLEEYADA